MTTEKKTEEVEEAAVKTEAKTVAKKAAPKSKAGVPAIYGAVLKVIEGLEIEKDGVLPANKGGKAYRSVEAFTAGIKKLFVENGIILVSNEEVIEQGRHEFKERVTYVTVIHGTYELVSVVDGSSITVSGTGRGHDTGASTDANMASTFAFKNAMQRTLLVAENDTEEAGMRDGTPGPSRAERAAQGAANAPVRKAAPKRAGRAAPSKADVDEQMAKEKVRDDFVRKGVLDGTAANAELAKLREAGDKTPYQTLLAALKKGELPGA